MPRNENAATALATDRDDSESAEGFAASTSAEPLRGEVIANDSGVAGARVWAVLDTRLHPEALAPSDPSVAESTTDADGRFSLDVPADRAYIVYARGSGPAVGAVFVSAPERECTIDLPEDSRQRSFRVVDIEERPVARTTVLGTRSVLVQVEAGRTVDAELTIP